jgi:glucokinase
MLYLGIDLGGTNIVAGIVSEDNKIVCKKSVLTNLPKSPVEIVEEIYSLTESLLTDEKLTFKDIRSIGIGIPGTVNLKTGVVEFANNLNFIRVPLINLIKQYFPIPVYYENDARAAAFGEYIAGAGRTSSSMIMMTLGTGVGGCIILNGKIWHGINSAAGEIGHMVIQYNGKQCSCGRKGCLEAYASASALTEKAVCEVEKHPDSMLYSAIHTTKKCNGKMVIDAVRQNDLTACSIFNTYCEYLSEGIINLINIFQPEKFIIGGGLSASGDLLLKPLKELVYPKIYSRYSSINTDIRLAELGNDAGIIGAARIALSRDVER